MPGEHQPAGSPSELPVWRERIAADIGEDPGRYLDRDLAADRPGGDMSTREWLLTRIRGIGSLATIGAWQAVERRLGRGPDGGPRPAVMALLRERAAELEANGERADHLARAVIPSREERVEMPTAAEYREMARKRGVSRNLLTHRLWGTPLERVADGVDDLDDGDDADGDDSGDADATTEHLGDASDGSVDRWTDVGPTLAGEPGGKP